jgi:hypothetical protein
MTSETSLLELDNAQAQGMPRSGSTLLHTAGRLKRESWSHPTGGRLSLTGK